VGFTQQDNQYRVRITFVDELAGVDNGMIIMQGAKTQSFRGNTVEILLPKLVQIGYKVIDGAGNEASGLIQLADYAPASISNSSSNPESQSFDSQSSVFQSGHNTSSSSFLVES
jgi:hypothetical protein